MEGMKAKKEDEVVGAVVAENEEVENETTAVEEVAANTEVEIQELDVEESLGKIDKGVS